MQTTDEVPQTYEEAERLLARWQGEGGPADLVAYASPDPTGETVRLLYVSDDFAPEGVIRQMTFGRSTELPFKSSTALATPSEWELVLSGKLSLPLGWDVAARRQVWP
jgi:hypothetical protein